MTRLAPKREPRKERLLIEENAVVAQQLRENPGTWFLVGVADLKDSRTMAQTAYRIRLNYRVGRNGRREGLSAFAEDEHGYFEATSTADTTRPNKVADVELSARYVLTDPGD